MIAKLLTRDRHRGYRMSKLVGFCPDVCRQLSLF